MDPRRLRQGTGTWTADFSRQAEEGAALVDSKPHCRWAEVKVES